MLDSWAAWDRWRKVVIARYKAQGPNCPLGSLMTQVGNVPGAAEVSTALLQNWQDHVERGIDIMQAKGEIDPSINPRRTAAAFIAGIQGGVTVLRTTGRTEHLEAILRVLFDYLRRPSG